MNWINPLVYSASHDFEISFEIITRFSDMIIEDIKQENNRWSKTEWHDEESSILKLDLTLLGLVLSYLLTVIPRTEVAKKALIFNQPIQGYYHWAHLIWKGEPTEYWNWTLK